MGAIKLGRRCWIIPSSPPSLFVLFTFAFLYSVTTFCVIIPWLNYSVPGVQNLGVLTLTTAVSLWCFFACANVDPGRVPSDWHPERQQVSAVQEVKKKGGTPRFCQKCNQFKPPRAHHCRVCQRCVLKMDHHCPWTASCIGHRNYRYFLLLLLYGTAALAHSLLLLLAHALHLLQSSQALAMVRTGPNSVPIEASSGFLRAAWLQVSLQVLATCLAIPATVSMAMLLLFHVRMVLRNQTTIEHAEGVTAEIKAMNLSGKGPRSHHPYDLGPCNNLHAICGDNPAAWVLPPLRPDKGGTHYPTAFDLGIDVDYDSFL